MKKYLLSFSVILASIFYVIWQNWSGKAQLNNISVASENNIHTEDSSQDNQNNPLPSTDSSDNASVTNNSNAPKNFGISNNSGSAYKDGQFTGNIANAYYGNVQIGVIIQDKKITDVQFLDYPHDRSTSREINNQAMPILKSEAIKVQSAKVSIVSGATFTSRAFQQSLGNALNQANL